jgi:hypothetical protein
MHPLFRWLLGIVGVLIAAAALVVNVKFYSSYGTDTDTQLIFTALAVISLAIKLLAPAAAPYSPSKLAAVCLWIGFAAAVIFDSLGTAGYMEMTYGTKTGEASRYADEYKKAADEVSQLETDYKSYAATRPTGVISTELEAAEAVAGKCPARRAHTDACMNVADLKTELAKADERDKREAEWKTAKLKFDSKDKPQIAADPQGAVFKRLGSRIGLDGLGSFVALIISILIFSFFELGGPALLYVAVHGQGGTKTALPPRDRDVDLARAPRKSGSRGAPLSASGVLETLKALRSSGAEGVTVDAGKLAGSQRALGKALGISGAKMNRHLSELKAAGSIDVRTGPNGTVISILGV